MMDLKQALKRIEELERKVAQLEGRPQHIHHHTHLAPPLPGYYQQIQQPWSPTPWNPLVPYCVAGLQGQIGQAS